MADAEKKASVAGSRKSTAKSGKAAGSTGRKTPQSGRSSPSKKSTGKKTPTGKTPEPTAEAEPGIYYLQLSVYYRKATIFRVLFWSRTAIGTASWSLNDHKQSFYDDR